MEIAGKFDAVFFTQLLHRTRAISPIAASYQWLRLRAWPSLKFLPKFQSLVALHRIAVRSVQQAVHSAVGRVSRDYLLLDSQA